VNQKKISIRQRTNYRSSYRKKSNNGKVWLFIIILIGALAFFAIKTSDGRKIAKDIYSQFKKVEKSKPSYTKEEIINANAGKTVEYTLYSAQTTFDQTSPSFIKLIDNKLVITPGRDDIGNYTVSLKSEDPTAIYLYNLNIKVELPVIDFAKLKLDTETILGTQINKYSIYVYDLKREQGFGINEEKVFYPASISKLPYAILILRDVDAGKFTKASINTDMTSLITHSDNAALMRFEKKLGGYAVVNQRIKNELGVDNIFRYPHTCQAVDIGTLYKGIYAQTYLSESSNDYLINLLENTDSAYDDRVQQGLPDGVEFAHKIGWITTSGGEAYNDSGIVYGELTDYVIVVLDKDVTSKSVIKMTKPLSETIYNALNR
jgi:hypothetical protein